MLIYEFMVQLNRGKVMDYESIVAISTPMQEGAISIVRLSGEDVISIVQKITNIDLVHVKSHLMQYGFIIDPKTRKKIDEVFICVFLAPRSYTSENMVEIHCHGGLFISKRVVELCLRYGAQLAQKGEFSKRAFLNGRIDLSQAEAVMDLISADTQNNLDMAMQAMQGSVRKLIDPLLEELLDMSAFIEVQIDYPEYDDMEKLTQDGFVSKEKAWIVKLEEILKRSQSGQIIKSGIQTLIVGKPNVGKSSLLNALLEEDKALVSEYVGTTRDIVEGDIQIDGLKLHLLDSAGIHESEDQIETMGILKSIEMIDQAQLIIVLLDASTPMDEADANILELTKEKLRIVAYNKADLCTTGSGIEISAKEHKIEALLKEIHALFDHHQVLQDEILGNARQIACVEKSLAAMKDAVAATAAGFELELVQIDIQNAYKSLKEVIGEVYQDDLLDTLFANFCLGK